MLALSIDRVSRGTDYGAFINFDGRIQFNWKDMVERGKIEWFCCRGCHEHPGGGESTSMNIDAARHFVDIVGEYYDLDPEDTAQSMIDRIVRDVDLNKPDFIWLDVEISQDSHGQTFGPDRINNSVQTVYNNLKNRFPDIRLTIYSRFDFIATFSPQMFGWMRSLDHIADAAWPDYGLDVYFESWEQIASGVMKECLNFTAPPPRPERQINVFDGHHGPPMQMVPGASVVFWQASSRIRPLVEGDPVFNHSYDFDYVNLPLDKFKRWLKFQPLEPVVEQPVTPLDVHAGDGGQVGATLAALDARVKALEAEQQRIQALPAYHQLFPEA